MNTPVRRTGFSLVEFIAVISVLAIVGVGVTRFAGDSAYLLASTPVRDGMVLESSAFLQRLSEDLAYTVGQNHVPVISDQGKCLALDTATGTTRYCVEGRTLSRAPSPGIILLGLSPRQQTFRWIAPQRLKVQLELETGGHRLFVARHFWVPSHEI